MRRFVKILILPVGSAGDVHPLVGLGQVLRDHGHDVTVVLNEYFMELGRRAGLACVEMGSSQDFLRLANDPAIWHPLKAFGHIFREGVSQLMREQYELIRTMRDTDDLLLIAPCLAFGARIAQEKFSLRCITVHLQPAVLWSAHASPGLPGYSPRGPRWLKNGLFRLGEKLFISRPVLPATNSFRSELGLGPIRRISQWWHSPDAVLGLFPAWYAPPQPDWPPNVVLTDFPMWDESQIAELPEAVESFLAQGEPPIVFAPGSAMVFGGEFFQTAVQVCRKLGRRGILLSRFREHLPTSLPDEVRHFEYIPFSQVLPRAAALVHHGGIGTTSQALAAGIPHLVRPMAHDQPDNALRVKRLGVGDWLHPSRFNVRTVCEKLTRLLESEAVGQSCARIAHRFAQRDGLELACAAIERFAG
jgi:UDP:flavonoid glycosyltransferase YjiC (YdhE family)